MNALSLTPGHVSVSLGDYVNLVDYLQVRPTDSEAMRKAKEDVKYAHLLCKPPHYPAPTLH